MKLSRGHWVAAAALAVLTHAALLVELRSPTPGEPPGGRGPQIEVLGSAATVFGTKARTPEEPSPTVSADMPEKITAEPPGAPAAQIGPEKAAPEDVIRPAKPADAETAETVDPTKTTEAPRREAVAAETVAMDAVKPVPAESAAKPVLPATDQIEAESEEIAMPVRRPEPTKAEREPVSKPKRTTSKPDRKQGKRQRQTSGKDRGKRRSGAPTATKRRGARQRRPSASPGQVRRYAGLVRARIARNRPSSRGRRGTAIVRFAISRSGRLRYARLARSSGDRTLDRAALASVRRASPFPRPPRGMSARQLTFSIPFRFR